MAVASVAPVTFIPGTQVSEDRVPSKSLTQNDFLKLLVAQMTQQDPLNPKSDIEMIPQMVSFTQLEQSKNMHDMSADVQDGVQSLVAASKDVRSISARFDSTTARGEVQQIVADAATAAKEMRETSRRLLEISGRLGSSEERLHRFIANGDSVMAKVNRGDGS